LQNFEAIDALESAGIPISCHAGSVMIILHHDKMETLTKHDTASSFAPLEKLSLPGAFKKLRETDSTTQLKPDSRWHMVEDGTWAQLIHAAVNHASSTAKSEPITEKLYSLIKAALQPLADLLGNTAISWGSHNTEMLYKVPKPDRGQYV
jgi:hypothetical protein